MLCVCILAKTCACRLKTTRPKQRTEATHVMCVGPVNTFGHNLSEVRPPFRPDLRPVLECRPDMQVCNCLVKQRRPDVPKTALNWPRAKNRFQGAQELRARARHESLRTRPSSAPAASAVGTGVEPPAGGDQHRARSAPPHPLDPPNPTRAFWRRADAAFVRRSVWHHLAEASASAAARRDAVWRR